MSVGAKRRAVAVGLVLFGLWPLVHRVLVMRYDISPWRFFGWAMYCQPKLPLEVDIYLHRDGARLLLDEAVSPRPELRQQRLAYARRREMWGALLPPAELAHQTLEAIADAEAAEIVVRRLLLRAPTAHIEVREQTYIYPRSGT